MKRGRSDVRPDEDFYRQVSIAIEGRQPVVLVTVVSSSGSAPGKPGAKMLVTREATHGQVGGGRVEAAAIRRARELLGVGNSPEVAEVHVVKDLGMSCGGSMTLMYEPLNPPPRLVIFGAGHVSRALAPMAGLAGFDVVVCDEREEWLTEEAFPTVRERILTNWAEAVERVALSRDTLVASVSPGHAVDRQVVSAIFNGGVTPRYLGVIGSQRKGILFKEELIEDGLPREEVEKIRIPMGVDIGAVEPAEIAISIVAELITTLRGLELPTQHTSENDGNDD